MDLRCLAAADEPVGKLAGVLVVAGDLDESVLPIRFEGLLGIYRHLAVGLDGQFKFGLVDADRADARADLQHAVGGEFAVHDMKGSLPDIEGGDHEVFFRDTELDDPVRAFFILQHADRRPVILKVQGDARSLRGGVAVVVRHGQAHHHAFDADAVVMGCRVVCGRGFRCFGFPVGRSGGSVRVTGILFAFFSHKVLQAARARQFQGHLAGPGIDAHREDDLAVSHALDDAVGIDQRDRPFPAVDDGGGGVLYLGGSVREFQRVDGRLYAVHAAVVIEEPGCRHRIRSRRSQAFFVLQPRAFLAVRPAFVHAQGNGDVFVNFNGRSVVLEVQFQRRRVGCGVAVVVRHGQAHAHAFDQEVVVVGCRVVGRVVFLGGIVLQAALVCLGQGDFAAFSVDADGEDDDFGTFSIKGNAVDGAFFACFQGDGAFIALDDGKGFGFRLGDLERIHGGQHAVRSAVEIKELSRIGRIRQGNAGAIPLQPDSGPGLFAFSLGGLEIRRPQFVFFFRGNVHEAFVDGKRRRIAFCRHARSVVLEFQGDGRSLGSDVTVVIRHRQAHVHTCDGQRIVMGHGVIRQVALGGRIVLQAALAGQGQGDFSRFGIGGSVCRPPCAICRATLFKILLRL